MGSYALVAESDPSRASLYARILAERGCETCLSRDGAGAIETLGSRGRPALIVANLSLPGADGFAVLREARRLFPDPQPPAAVVSAFGELRAAAETLRHVLAIQAILPSGAPENEVRSSFGAALEGRESPPVDPPRESTGSGDAGRESRRLERIERMGIVDDLPPDEALQSLVRKTAEAFRVPVALVSLILEDRQWFKAYVGLTGAALEARATPRDWSICRHVVEGREPLVVPDARSHPYFRTNPLVKAGAVGSYAGAPLVTPGGEVLGTLCIVDSKPLAITADEVDVLVLLARRVAGEIEMRSRSWRRLPAAAGEAATPLRIPPPGRGPTWR